MTRKDFELIAGELKELKTFIDIPGIPGSDEYEKGKHDTWYIITSNLASRLATTNPAFDRERFLKASGVEDADA